MSLRRKLRSQGACQPLQNIFKSEHYREILPPLIYQRITKTSTVNCDRIESLKLEASPNHSENIRLMRLAQVEDQVMIQEDKNMDNIVIGKQGDDMEEDQDDYIGGKWKNNHLEMQIHHQNFVYGEEMLNINFLKDIDRFIMQ